MYVELSLYNMKCDIGAEGKLDNESDSFSSMTWNEFQADNKGKYTNSEISEACVSRSKG